MNGMMIAISRVPVMYGYQKNG